MENKTMENKAMENKAICFFTGVGLGMAIINLIWILCITLSK